MKKLSRLLIILLAFSLIANVYLFVQNKSANTKLLNNEVAILKTYTQNAVAGIKNNDDILLRQSLSNFQTKPPFATQGSVDSVVERVVNRYEDLFKSALNGDQENNTLLLTKLEKSFQILVPLSETEKLEERQIEIALTKIDNILSEE
ncbi:hypothetical protein M3204_23595 [Mesobacillus subterraneus]|uniref:hypothetical protein n=1 Tax=Mesobacillus subterraneus TaxID=285983 RepID=UPI00203ED389|nr:hypothetical protein [Mesobacillus subterraneus]MCM3667362.1 hypothetical protein [Mesobacillus subterraneus]MCM3686357.1 hypothetical protein [Mesobacillus subterraneus]